VVESIFSLLVFDYACPKSASIELATEIVNEVPRVCRKSDVKKFSFSAGRSLTFVGMQSVTAQNTKLLSPHEGRMRSSRLKERRQLLPMVSGFEYAKLVNCSRNDRR
jgi:hypothetical protein